MSTGAGSAISGSRCNKMPTWRWSRTACWAAPIDFGRPSVIGSTSPGNSTVLRTGTIISASAGKGGSVLAPSVESVFASISTSATADPRFLQGDHQTTIDNGTAHRTVAASRQPQPPVKAPLRQFQPMNGRRAQGGRIGARPGNNQFAVLDDGFHLFGIDAWQGHERQNFEIGLQNIDRRLPNRLTRLGARRPEQLAVHPVGAREHLARFRPHPIANHIAGHKAFPPTWFGYVWRRNVEFNGRRGGLRAGPSR